MSGKISVYTDRKKETVKRREKELIGIAGSGRCVGATHFALLISNYMQGVLGRKTALLEWNEKEDFDKIHRIMSKKAVLKEGVNTFNILGVTFYGKAGKNELLECAAQGFQAVIIDFGAYTDSIAEEILRCDRMFLLGSFSEWQLEIFADLVSECKSRKNRWEYFYAFGSEENAEMMKECLGVFVRQIPIFPDAFAITGEAMAFFREFLK